MIAKTLKHIFLAVAEPYVSVVQAFNAKAGRGMTAGEIKLAQGLFGDAIDYSRVRICETIASATLAAMKSTLYIPRRWKARHDLSQSTGDRMQDALRKSVFLHEMAHIWQNDNSRWWFFKSIGVSFLSTILRRDVYKYDLRDDKKFGNLGREQQAQMVEDYVFARELLAGPNPAFTGFSINGLEGKDVIAFNEPKIRKSFPLVLKS